MFTLLKHKFANSTASKRTRVYNCKKIQKNHKKDLQNKRKYIIMVSKWRKVVRSGIKKKRGEFNC